MALIERELVIIGAKARLAALEVERAELEAYLDQMNGVGVAAPPTAGRVVGGKIPWQLRPENADKVKAWRRKMKRVAAARARTSS